MCPLVYIIVLNYNGWPDTIECLESLLRLQYDNFHLIVIDNDSGDDSLESIRLWARGELAIKPNTDLRLRALVHPPVAKPITVNEISCDRINSGYSLRQPDRSTIRLIQTGSNLGFAGGNNIGLRLALNDTECRYVWLVNNDAVVKPDALTKLVHRIEQNPHFGICGSTLLYYHHPDRVQALGGAAYNCWLATTRHIGAMTAADAFIDAARVEPRLSYVIGASLLLSRPFLEQVGPMREDYFFYFDELDWCLRARGRYDITYAPESIVYHKEGKAIGANHDTRHKSRLADYFWTKNRLKITRRFFPYALPTVYLTLLGAIFNRIRRRQWDRIPMIIKIALGR